MGTPDFGVTVLKSLVDAGCNVVAVYTGADSPAGRGRQSTPSPVKLVAMEAGLPITMPNSLRGAAAANALRSLEPDLVVVAAFGHILPAEMLSIPTHGCLNVHPSLLPLYRGPSPVAAALLNGDGDSGVSIMLMDTGLDTGPIVAQERVTISDEETCGSLTGLLAQRGASLLLSIMPEWLSGSLTPRPQCDEAASYSSRISAKDGLIDWDLPAETLDREVRAYSPWPGSYTTLKGRRLKVHRAAALAIQSEAPPGTVVGLAEPFLVGVSAGVGILALRSIQLEGKREVATGEFLRGHRDFLGSKLGQ